MPLDGNGGYDVARYVLDLAYDPDTDRLSGTATIRARATQDLSRFDLDLQGMRVRSVAVDGRAATFDRDGQELVVTPRAGIERRAPFTVVVRYGGVPETIVQRFGRTGFVATDDGAYAACEPDAAKTWYPVNGHPSDRASYRFVVTVPGSLVVIANGKLERRVARGGSTTWTWDASEPMAPYLATVAIGRFDLHRYDDGGIAYVDAIDSGLDGGIRPALERQPEIIDFLADRFGPYPFTEAGAIVDDAELSYSLETQTRPIYSPGIFSGSDATRVLVHELAHQWFGDSVSLARWRDVWLNEGFATYAEWMWDEAHGGRSRSEQFDRLYGQAPTSRFWAFELRDPGRQGLFDQRVYDRGAMTLEALRTTVGDADFERILRRWATDMAGRSATTADFERVAEEVSGDQLDDLFDHWLSSDGRPDRP